MRRYTFTLPLIMITLSLFAYQSPTFDYNAAWIKVNKAIKDQLPKTALKELDLILAAANTEKDSPELIKTVIYRTRLILHTEELGLERVIADYNEVIATSHEPAKQILQSAMAEIMQNYFNNNYYILSRRTDIADYIPDDIRTWAPNQYRSFISQLYLESTTPTLTQYKTEEYKMLLRNVGEIDYTLRPTLYELLLDRAIQYFSNNNLLGTAPSFSFKLDKESYLEPARAFIKQDINSPDTASLQLKVIQLYQRAIARQLEGSSEKALLDYDLLRYDYLAQHATVKHKDQALLDAYLSSREQYKTDLHKDIWTYRTIALYQRTDRVETAISVAKKLAKKRNDYGSQAQQWLDNLYNPTLSIQSESLFSSQEPVALDVDSRNLNGFYTSIYDINNWSLDQSRTIGQQIDQIIGLRKIDTQYQKVDSMGYTSSKLSVAIDPKPIGKYLVVVHSAENLKAENTAIYYAPIQVTDIVPTLYQTFDKNYFITRDRATGAAKQTTIKIEQWEWDRKSRQQQLKSSKSYRTDNEGMCLIPSSNHSTRNLKVNFIAGKDIFTPERNLYLQGHHESSPYKSTELFLDRSIYRPGQTVYFKGLHLKHDKNRVPQIAPNQKIELALRDANYQVVQELSLTTNEYGSIEGSFLLPQGLLTGNFTLQADNGSISFSVEEYKRPTFQVSFAEQEKDIKLGDNVTVKATAKAYSGAAVNKAKVEYTVYREQRYYWRYWNPVGKRTQVTKGTAYTNQKGECSFDFEAAKDSNAEDGQNPSYYYSIEANITDINGETRSAKTGISVAVIPYYFTTNLKKIYDLKELDTLDISVKRNTGELTDAKAKLVIEKLVTPKEWTKAKSNYIHHYRSHGIDNISTALSGYAIEREILSQEIDIPVTSYRLDLAKQLTQGSYKISIKSIDKFDGSEASYESYLVVNNKDKKQIEPAQLLYTSGEEKEWKIGKHIEIKLASPSKALHVYYAFMNGNKIKKEGWLKLNKTSVLKYRPDINDKGGISLHLDYNYKNTFQSKNLSLQIPWTEKKLDISLTSFRSVLEPGSKEKWTLKIAGQGKETVAAEMLASMYDSSLDQYKSHRWNWSGFPSHYGTVNLTQFTQYASNYRVLNYHWNKITRSKLPTIFRPVLDINFGNYYYNGRVNNLTEPEIIGYKAPMMEMDNSSQGMMRSKSKRSAPSRDMSELATTSAGISGEDSDEIRIRGSRTDATTYSIDGISVSGKDKDQAPSFDFSPRKNLNETVFFYPQLKTDKEGNILLEFTMNEALTTWKLMCLAHDKELRYGFLTQEIKTQKDLMVQPNAPRFLREGDEITFPAKVSNLTDTAITAYAILELKDAATDKDLNATFLQSDKQITIEIPAKESAAVTWDLAIPKDFKSTVKYTVKVSSGSHTDGEENILPVVTNRKLVTETKVFHLKKQTEKSLDITQLTNLGSSTASPYSLTLEYTANPVWYAIQALPYIMDYPHSCTEQVFHRYYANTLASHIANASPKIKEIFDIWKAADSDAFLSNLDKNKELKYAILEETPWVKAAQSEADQKRRIALLFDYNKMSIERSSELATLTQRQLPSGGFPWFKGGREDVYITQLVIEGFLHLRKLNVLDKNDPEVAQILNRAMQYLEEQSIKRYNDLLKHSKDLARDHLDHLSLQYLYICSYDPDFEPSKRAKPAYEYYYGQSIAHWRNKNLMSQSMIGIILFRSNEKTHLDITASLKEKSFYSEELGRYWNLGNGYRWYDLPIESHASLIEYFTEIGDSGYQEDLKIWLLKNKQTNRWSTTKSTARAIYALLISGESDGMSQWIYEANPPAITIDGTPIDFDNWAPEAGTGYVKQRWAASDDIPEQIDIKNNNETIAWGAVYNQYFEQLDKIEVYNDNPLAIERQLYLQKETDYGPQLSLITPETKLVPGDRIKTRITIKTDRSMSYVHLKDMRGSGMEPENVLSSYKYQGSFGYYESTRDLASHFFISHLPKGTHVFEYPVRVVHAGTFSTGIATIQCMYAPEFTSHSEGEIVKVVAEE